MSFLNQAFHEIIKDAKTPEGNYISLMERVPFYGGPEEGGWHGSDTNLIAYHYCETEEEANLIKDQIVKLAEELQQESKKEYGEQCLREMEWLDARGLEADFLPEPDGPSEFLVVVSDELPRSSKGCRHYE